MRTDWYTKALLTVIAVALAAIAVRPLLAPSPSYAARKIEYKIVPIGTSPAATWQTQFTSLGNDGWELAALDSDLHWVVMKR